MKTVATIIPGVQPPPPPREPSTVTLTGIPIEEAKCLRGLLAQCNSQQFTQTFDALWKLFPHDYADVFVGYPGTAGTDGLPHYPITRPLHVRSRA